MSHEITIISPSKNLVKTRKGNIIVEILGIPRVVNFTNNGFFSMRLVCDIYVDKKSWPSFVNYYPETRSIGLAQQQIEGHEGFKVVLPFTDLCNLSPVEELVYRNDT